MLPELAKSLPLRTKSTIAALWPVRNRLAGPSVDDAAGLSRAQTSAVEWLQSHFAIWVTTICGVGLVLEVVDQYRLYQMAFTSWDILFLSGLATFLVGFRMALSIPARLTETLARLRDRNVLDNQGTRLAGFAEQLSVTSRRWSFGGATLIPIILVVATVLAVPWPDLTTRASFLLVEIATGVIAGYYLGRMSLYGFLVGQLQRAGLALQVKPGHIDGCAGMKPVGDFYFYQAMVTGLPAAFIAVWLLVIPVWHGGRYAAWLEPYRGLLPIAILLEMFAFIVPIWSFHRDMAQQKVALMHDADALSLVISRIETSLASDNAGLPRDFLKDRLDHLTKQYWDIENMPTWPMDVSTGRSFAINNLALVVPLITQGIGLDAVWPNFGNIAAEVLKGLGAQS